MIIKNTKKMDYRETRNWVKLITGCLLFILGMVLVVLGFYAVPIGEVHTSIITILGIACTYAGAVLGFDFTFFKKFGNGK
jgi:hypothetical protein